MSICHIMGYVRDAKTLKGIHPAEISNYLILGNDSTLTINKDGFYWISASSGKFTLTATATGYAPQTSPTVEVLGWPPRRVDFKMISK